MTQVGYKIVYLFNQNPLKLHTVNCWVLYVLYFKWGKKEEALIQSLDYQLTEELMNTISTNSNKNSHKELYREL